MAMKRNIYNNEYKSQKKKYTAQSARYDGESPNWSFRSFRGSKDFNDVMFQWFQKFHTWVS